MDAEAPAFRLTPKQAVANALLASDASHIMLYGGSRSGKTFLYVRALVIRALLEAGTNHAAFRLNFNAAKMSLFGQTFPEVMRKCFPKMVKGRHYDTNKQELQVTFAGGSTIMMGGLDDKERTEKILGLGFCTVFLNECSQISYASRNMVVTRLAQQTRRLRLKEYSDCNPPTIGHWTYRLYEERVEPMSRQPLLRPQDFVSMLINPIDNKANLAPEYIRSLDELPAHMRARFRDGKYQAAVEGALWTQADIDAKARGSAPANKAEHDALVQSLAKVVVAVDPSGCSGPEDERSDEIGIVAVGQRHDGQNLVLEDASGRMAPEGWAAVAIRLLDKWKADAIVGETNFGGDMVRAVIHGQRAGAPFRMVTASRGKVRRAEPIAALYAEYRVTHCGVFPDLEEQLCNFSAAGYMGSRSPDRADAAIWGLTELNDGAAVVISGPMIITAPYG